MTTGLRAACALTCLLALSGSTSSQTATAEQTAYLKALTTVDGDHLGYSVAISGDTLVIGAPFESGDSEVVNGVFNPGGAPNSGAAYVFVRDGASWVQEAYIKPSNTGTDDLFGSSVAIDGDLLVVGAPEEDGFATGVNGNMGDGIGTMESGAAYIFERTDGTWRQAAYLKASNTDKQDLFGSTVTISGETVVVGAPFEASNATGINGNQVNNSHFRSGAAYVYLRVENTWTLRAYLKASNSSAVDHFGSFVDLTGDTLVVGAPFESSAGTRAGAAYVFIRQAGTWSEQALVQATAPSEHAHFGDIVATSEDTLVVAAPGADSAYAFERTGGTWSQGVALHDIVSAPGKLDVTGLDVSGNRIAVSGRAHTTGDPQSHPPAVFLFSRADSTWNQEAIADAPVADPGDMFGDALSLSGNTLVVGAYGEESLAQGVDGDPLNDSGFLNGAAFTFEIEPSPWTDEGSALAGVSGEPQLAGNGTLAGASANSLSLSNAAPSALSGVFASLVSTPVNFKGGTLKAFPFVFLTFANTGLAGELTLPFTMPASIPGGTELWVQVAISDAAAVANVALSNAVKGVTP